MRKISIYSLPFLSGLILFLSIIALLVNHYIYQFPGNSFFPDDMLLMICVILVFNLGLIVFFGKNSRAANSGRELIYFFCVMSIIALASNAIQFTPFSPIDKEVLSFDGLFKINIPAILEWTSNHPYFRNILGFTYDTLPYQMSVLPLFVIMMGRFHLLREYLFLLLFTALIGFAFYYFFPTTAPASIIESPLFSPYQIATGFKFNQIHHHIIPTTDEGGLIALPSFHTIWALLCVYLLKEWFILCAFLFVVNCLLIISCVFLGWHYLTDVLAAIILVVVSYYFLRFYKNQQTNNKTLF